MDKPIIFISHITEEKELALELKKIIKKKFLSMAEVFVSSDENSIELGHEWLENITNGLRTCSIELILCSPVSISRPWINFEAGAGWVRKDCRVIPICHSNIQPDSLPLPLNLLQGMMLNDKIKFQELLKIIANQIGCDIPELDCDDFIASVKTFEEKYTYWEQINNNVESFLSQIIKNGFIRIEGSKIEEIHDNTIGRKYLLQRLYLNGEINDVGIFLSQFDRSCIKFLESINFLKTKTIGMSRCDRGNYESFNIIKMPNYDSIVQNINFQYSLNEVTNAK